MNPRFRLALLAAAALVACGPPAPGDPDYAQMIAALGPASPGLDRAGVLSVTEATNFKNQYGVQWAGAYVGGPCNGGSGWTKSALTSIYNATGWQFMPIYVGQTANVCGASNFTAAQGTTDGQDAVTVMQSYSWAPNANIPVCLDYEAQNGSGSAGTAYVHAWLDAVHAGGYKAYVYSNPSNLNAFSSAGLPIDGAWAANWNYSSFQAGLSPASDTSLNGFSSGDRAWQYASDNSVGVDWDTANVTLAPAPGMVNAASPTLDQESGNDVVTLITWTDGHIEAFFTTPGNALKHTWTNGTTETWTAAAPLDTGAECGSAAIYWPSPWLYGEVFSPRTNGATGHLWETNGTWNTYQAWGGTNLSHFQAVTWQDGHTEVFALGADHAIWHQYWDATTMNWSGWQSLGGNVVSAPGAIVWGDGHGEVFATAADGSVQHSWSAKNGGSWSAWASLGGSLASHPVPVRLKSGNVDLLGIGTDGLLYESTFNAGWSAFTAVDSTTQLFGEPSVVLNSGGSIEVFARDTEGKVVHTWSGTSWAPVQALGAPQLSAADPFGWIRADGTCDVFAVDSSGQLLKINRDAQNAWGTWDVLATGAANCSAQVPPPPVDAGSSDAGSIKDGGSSGSDGGSVGQDAGSSAPDSGTPSEADAGTEGTTTTGCHCGQVSGNAFAFPGLLVGLALLALRRRPRPG